MTRFGIRRRLRNLLQRLRRRKNQEYDQLGISPDGKLTWCRQTAAQAEQQQQQQPGDGEEAQDA